ncbi:antibiotic biosynthesis monooxygenase family protein [Micromonospora sp. NPDC050200]|uniref:putative quinol monooxygenase n=1 Tax=Micromonospora sp. NPDC050200 TaxID=3155664 RepID=UPI0033F6EA7F
MLIVAGSLYVDPAGRDAYLASCAETVRQARSAPGCVDFAISADLVEPGRINVYERWESDEQLLAFRGSGPSEEQTVAILGAEVHRYRISGVGAP